MIGWISRMASRRGRVAAAVALATLVVFALAGAGVKERLSVGGFVDPTAESSVAAKELEATFGSGPPNYVLVATAQQGDVLDPPNTASGLDLVAPLRGTDGVLDLTSAWTLGALPPDTRNPLRSINGDKAVIAIRLGGDEDEQRATADRLAHDYSGRQGRFDVTATGPAQISAEAAEQAEKDLLRAELIAAPLTLVGLLLVFRGWRAALIPLAVAAFAVLGTFTALSV